MITAKPRRQPAWRHTPTLAAPPEPHIVRPASSAAGPLLARFGYPNGGC